MSKSLGVGYAIMAVLFGWYLYWNKPACQQGVPVMGFGSGWYCAAGYKP